MQSNFTDTAPGAPATSLPGVVWTPEDSKAAAAEGWDVFDSSDRGLEIERIDCPEDAQGNPIEATFKTDGEALGHVYGRAQSGSALHQKAILLTLARMKGFELPRHVPPSVERALRRIHDIAVDGAGNRADIADVATMALQDLGVVLEPAERVGLEHLVDVCERAGYEVQYDDEHDAWEWRDEHGAASQVRHECKRQAALDALEHRYKDVWRFEVANGDTRRGFVEFCEAQVEEAEAGMTP